MFDPLPKFLHPICTYFGRKRLFTSFAAACRESRSVEVAASAGVLAPSASSDAKIPKSSRAETSRGISLERENDLAERQLTLQPEHRVRRPRVQERMPHG